MSNTMIHTGNSATDSEVVRPANRVAPETVQMKRKPRYMRRLGVELAVLAASVAVVTAGIFTAVLAVS